LTEQRRFGDPKNHAVAPRPAEPAGHSAKAPPELGLGTWRLDGDRLTRAVEAALEAGYRHFDTAPAYHNERTLGRALAASGTPRERLFVVSKIWNSDQGRGLTRPACLASLERLGLDYLDLCLIHWPVAGRSLECWRDLEGLVAEGLIKGAGVSNFEEAQLERLFELAEIKPVDNQVEVHPHRSRRSLMAMCERLGVKVTAYCPLARGQLNKSQNLIRVAERLGRTVPQVILRWHLQKGRGVIPKSGDPERIRENARLFDFELTPADTRVLDRQNQDRSVLTPKFPLDSDGYVIDEAHGSNL
jgi:diketogulonate reductase-like aldo/keto reductase